MQAHPHAEEGPCELEALGRAEAMPADHGLPAPLSDLARPWAASIRTEPPKTLTRGPAVDNTPRLQDGHLLGSFILKPEARQAG